MLLSMLRLQPDISSFKCVDLQFLTSYIPDGCFKDVGQMLKDFINFILPDCLERLDWINVIPLLHIFLKKIQPFDGPVLAYNEIKWSDMLITMYKMKKATRVAISR